MTPDYSVPVPRAPATSSSAGSWSRLRDMKADPAKRSNGFRAGYTGTTIIFDDPVLTLLNPT